MSVLNVGKAKAATLPEGFIPNPKLKLLEQDSEVMRFKHYSIRTETTYREWIKRFIFFHGKRHPREMGLWKWRDVSIDWPPSGAPFCVPCVLCGFSFVEIRAIRVSPVLSQKNKLPEQSDTARMILSDDPRIWRPLT